MVRINPIYNIGAIAVSLVEVDGVKQPTVGQLQEAVWNINEKKRFKVSCI